MANKSAHWAVTLVKIAGPVYRFSVFGISVACVPLAAPPQAVRASSGSRQHPTSNATPRNVNQQKPAKIEDFDRTIGGPGRGVYGLALAQSRLRESMLEDRREGQSL